MIKKLLSLILATSLLAACGSSNDDSDNGAGNGNNGNGNGNAGWSSSEKLPTPNLAVPTNPIPESEWLGNWNDKTNPNYPGEGNVYNPIEGDWILTEINGKSTDLFLLNHFTYGLGLNVLTEKPAEGKAPNYKGYPQKCQINSTQFKDTRGYIYNYTLAADRSSLSFYDGTNTYTFGPYDNNGVWKWKGDWNDPKSLYYPVYNGNYNPLLGTWKVYRDRDSNVIYNRDILFDENLYMYERYITSDGKIEDYTRIGRYIINDTGFKIANGSSFLGYSTNKYWIANDTLYLQGILGSTPYVETSQLIRVK